MTTSTTLPHEFITCIQDTISEWKEPSQFPTALQIYHIGKLLSKLPPQSPVRSSLQQLLQVLPCSILEQLRDALFHVLEHNHSDHEEAVAAVAEIYQSSPRIPALTCDQITQLVTTKCDTRISILAMFLLRNQLEWEEYLPRLHLLHESLVWNDLIDWLQDHSPGWQQTLIRAHPEHSDYLQFFFQKEEVTFMPVSMELPPTKQQQQQQLTVEPSMELQRRIHQVLQIVPDFGEGFVEMCLSYYKGDVEQTVAALIDEQNLPPALRLLDRELPRRKVEGRNAAEETEEAKQIAKAALLVAQRQQEEEAYMLDMVMRQGAHDEYNDDYDDQYDETEGNRRASDQGLYDDYDAVRTYNRVLKGIVEEQAFWEEDRNTNHQRVETKGDAAAAEKTFRGADKIKGGRIPNAAGGRGGRGGRGRGNVGRGGRGRSKSPENATNGESSAGTTNDNRSKGNQRAKDRKLANRREKQKNAAAKRNI